MTNPIVALPGVSPVVFGFSILLWSQRKVIVSTRAKRRESVSTKSHDRNPHLAPSIILWGIIIVMVIVACGSLLVFFAPDAALQARIFMVNEDRTIKFITAPALRFVHASGLVLFLVLISFAAVLSRRPTLARKLVGNLLKDARSFLSRLSAAAKDSMAHDHGVEMICLVVIFLMAVAIRLFFLTQPMGYDEAITVVRFSSRTLLDVISDYSMPNNHIFHTILVHMSTGLFGIFPAVVRLPAFLAGLMIVPVSFWLMRRLFDDHTALLTAALTAVAPAMVEYSTQARGYTLLTLLFLIAFVSATYLQEQKSITAWIIFIVSFTLGFYTIPTMLYSFGIVALWLLFAAPQQRRKRLFVELTLASLAIVTGTLLLYLPVLLRSGYRSLLGIGVLTRMSLTSFLGWNARNLLFTAQCWIGSRYAPFIIVLGLCVLAAIVISWRNHKPVAFVPLAILLWMVPVIFVQRVAPFPRVFNFLFPIIAGFASYGLAMLFGKLHLVSGKRAQYVWAAMVIVISCYWGVHRLRTPCGPVTSGNQCAEGYFVDAQAIVNDLSPVLQERDALVAHVYSGIVETTRFYLLEANRQPTLVHAYSPRKGLHQLDQYDQLFVATRRDELTTPKDGADVLKMLNCSPEDFDKAFDHPELIASYQMSQLYRLHRKSTGSHLQ